MVSTFYLGGTVKLGNKEPAEFANLLYNDKEDLALWNNFRVTKKSSLSPSLTVLIFIFFYLYIIHSSIFDQQLISRQFLFYQFHKTTHKKITAVAVGVLKCEVQLLGKWQKICSKGLSVKEDYDYLWVVHSFDVEIFEFFICFVFVTQQWMWGQLLLRPSLGQVWQLFVLKWSVNYWEKLWSGDFKF